MGFERIGPYGLTRADLLAASFVISFRAGSLKTRIWCFGIAAALIGASVYALWEGVYILAGLCAFWLIYIFVIRSFLRSLKDSHDIWLSEDVDGIRADSAKTQTLYKWATIQKTVRAGPRLFVMINGQCGLVISERFTTADNIDALAATVQQNISAS